MRALVHAATASAISIQPLEFFCIYLYSSFQQLADDAYFVNDSFSFFFQTALYEFTAACFSSHRFLISHAAPRFHE